MLLVVVLFGMAVALLVYGMADTSSLAVRRDKDTAAAFASVKQALIGWSASRSPTGSNLNARPGELPCPDTDNNGYAENDDDGNGIDEASCPAGSVGRVPWRTLGIPEPKDSAGETLWYAISGNFRVYRSSAPNANTSPINSDTLGTITVYQESTSNTITDRAVAVIFAPGATLGTQDRSTTTTMSCTAPSGTYFRNQCAANYLESTAGVNNAAINGPYISAPGSDTFNDKVMVITTADLMTVVEIRVARELLALLNKYSTAPGKSCSNNCYTWADEDFNNEGDTPAFRGWLPLGEGDPDDWSGLGITIPAWLANNDWWKVIYYAVAPIKTENNSGGTLTVDGISGTHVVLITPGPVPPGVSRPVNTPGTPAYWAEYLKDSENSNHSNNIYVTPSSTAYARNRLYTIKP